MSAHLVITSLVIDEDQELDFESADRAVGALAAGDLIEPELYFDEDPEEPSGLEQIREELRTDLRTLREAIEGYREIEELRIRGARVFVTGGMSSGDGPTDIWDVIARLRVATGVLSAAGFEGQS